MRIKGRSSIDIIKHGGYKAGRRGGVRSSRRASTDSYHSSFPSRAQISALDIEAKLLLHPGLKECAVVGLPDETYGEVGLPTGWGRDIPLRFRPSLHHATVLTPPPHRSSGL